MYICTTKYLAPIDNWVDFVLFNFKKTILRRWHLSQLKPEDDIQIILPQPSNRVILKHVLIWIKCYTLYVGVPISWFLFDCLSFLNIMSMFVNRIEECLSKLETLLVDLPTDTTSQSSRLLDLEQRLQNASNFHSIEKTACYDLDLEDLQNFFTSLVSSNKCAHVLLCVF